MAIVVLTINTKSDPAYASFDSSTIGAGLTPVPAAPALAYTTNQNAVIGNLLRMNPTGGALSVFLPAALAGAGPIAVKVQSNSANGVTIVPNGTDTIDGVNASTVALSGREYMVLYSDGISDWMVLT